MWQVTRICVSRSFMFISFALKPPEAISCGCRLFSRCANPIAQAYHLYLYLYLIYVYLYLYRCLCLYLNLSFSKAASSSSEATWRRNKLVVFLFFLFSSQKPPIKQFLGTSSSCVFENALVFFSFLFIFFAKPPIKPCCVASSFSWPFSVCVCDGKG